MQIPSLRSYQTEAEDNLRQAHIDGHRQILWTGATGSGKTVIFSDIIAKAIRMGSRALVLVHRENILDQIVKSLARYNLNPGVIQGRNYWTGSKVHVAMVQSLSRRLDVMKNLGLLPDVIIVDEAHHCASPTYKKIIAFFLKHNPECVVLGFTATPERTDGIGLKEAGYSKLIEGPQYADLLNPDCTGGEVYLCEPIVFYSRYTSEINQAKSKMKNGDYDPDEEDLIFGSKTIVNDSVEMYKQYFNGAPAIIFCASVEDCNRVSDSMKEAGWLGGVVSEKVDRDKQKDLIYGLGSGKYNFICSYDIISEGTDIPVVAGCIIRRRTTSVIMYLQMVGRSARRYPGKKFNIVIDQAGVSRDDMHGHPLIRRKWSLEGSKKRGKREDEELITTTCDHCFALLAGKPKVCKFCGGYLKQPGPFNEPPLKVVFAPMEILPAPVSLDTEVMAEVEESEDADKAIEEAIIEGRIAFAKLRDVAHKLGKNGAWITRVWREANQAIEENNV